MSSTENESKKTCGDCKVEYEKSLSNFYGTGKIDKDGNKILKSICKSCHKAKSKKNYQNRKAKGIKYDSYTPNELRKEYFKKYYSDKEKIKKQNRAKYLRRKARKEAARLAAISNAE